MFTVCDIPLITSTALYTPSPTLHGHYNHYHPDINHTLPYLCTTQCPLTPLAAQSISSFMTHTSPISPIPPILTKFECSSTYKHTYFDRNTTHIHMNDTPWMFPLLTTYINYIHTKYIIHTHTYIHTYTSKQKKNKTISIRRSTVL